ncbi:MAG: ABC transporter substrate-binding protein, partial [Anaerotignum sp.]|nr:ABC transporter substrate-binding protein [Anaerotignum sp.]
EVVEVILPQFSESNLETLTTIIDRYKSQDTWKTDPLFSEDGFTLMQDIMDQGGELSARVPFDDLVTNVFAEKVIFE